MRASPIIHQRTLHKKDEVTISTRGGAHETTPRVPAPQRIAIGSGGVERDGSDDIVRTAAVVAMMIAVKIQKRNADEDDGKPRRRRRRERGKRRRNATEGTRAAKFDEV